MAVLDEELLVGGTTADALKRLKIISGYEKITHGLVVSWRKAGPKKKRGRKALTHFESAVIGELVYGCMEKVSATPLAPPPPTCAPWPRHQLAANACRERHIAAHLTRAACTPRRRTPPGRPRPRPRLRRLTTWSAPSSRPTSPLLLRRHQAGRRQRAEDHRLLGGCPRPEAQVSNGWVQNFLRRAALRKRHVTAAEKKLPPLDEVRPSGWARSSSPSATTSATSG